MPTLRQMVSFAVLGGLLATTASAAPPTVRGTVRDAGGAALAGVDVELVPLVTNYEWARQVLEEHRAVPPALVAGKTDTAGRFFLEAPRAGMYRVEVHRTGFVPMRFSVLPAAYDTVLPPVRLEADAGTRVEARWSSGEPASGVWIYASTVRQALWSEASADGWRVAARAGRTDAEGRLTLPRAADEQLVVNAFQPGCTRLASATGGARAVLTLAPLSPSAVVEVAAADGEPWPGLILATGDPPWPAGRIGRDAPLSLAGALPAALPLYLFAADGRQQREEVTGGAADGPRRVHIVLPPRQRVTGRVVAAATAGPLASALVWPENAPGTFVRTDARGDFELPAPREEGFRLRVDAQGFLPAVRQVRTSSQDTIPVGVWKLAKAAALGGRVVDGTGAPVSGAELTATFLAPRPPPFHPDPLLSRATTDDGGRFSLTSLHADGVYRLRVIQSGYATAWLDVGAARPGELLIRLEAARSVGGRVIDTEGQPIAGTEVKLAEAALLGPRRQPPSTAVSDEAGRFEFAEAPASRLDLQASRQGFSTLIVRGVEIPAGDGPVDLGVLVLERGAAVYGKVSDGDGEPIAGTRVWALRESGRSLQALARLVRESGEEPLATTDAEGSFRLENLDRGRAYHLFFDHPGYLPEQLPRVPVPAPEPLAVVLEPAATVSGVVVDAVDEPIAGAQVTLEREPRPSGEAVPAAGPENDATVFADRQGRFSFGQILPGKVRIGASASGYQPGPALALEIGTEERLTGLQLVLERGAEVVGWVSNREGEPVAGCRVHAGRSSAESDAEGFYRLDGLPPGALRLEAWHLGYDRQARELQVELGRQRADFVLTGGFRVAGRVVDGDGLPVSLAEVSLRHVAGGRYREYRATTGEQGEFRFDRVANGRCELWATKAGYAPGRREQDFGVDGADLEGLEVTLRRGAVLEGEVLGLEGGDLAALRIVAESQGVREDGFVDYEGGYRVADLGPGDYVVRAALPDGSRQVEERVVIPPGVRSVRRDLRFHLGLTLAGRVFYGGEPLPETRVTLTGQDVAARRTVITGYQGRYRIDDLEPGSYRLSVSHPWELLVHNEDLELRSDQELDVEIATASLSGVVTSAATSEPVADATVSLLQLLSPDGSQTGSRITLTSGPQGGFHVARLHAGRHRLSVYQEGYEPYEDVVEVEAESQVRGLEIALAPAPGLEMTVRLASGEVPSFVTAGAFDAEGRLFEAESHRPDADGRMRLSRIPAGRWSLLVTAAGGTAAGVDVTVPGPSPEVVLLPTSHLEVRVAALAESSVLASLSVAGEDGRPFAVLDPSGAMVGEWTVRNGRGELTGLPAGVWTLLITAADGREWRETLVTNGEREVAVALE